MATIDRNVLRIAAFEMLHGNTPGRVAINEAIDIARRYGGLHSGAFVNGILDRILRDDVALLEAKS
jgi:N utilization substance protein B